MNITVNEEPIDVPSDVKTIEDFRKHFNLIEKKAMIEHNKVALRPDEYTDTELNEGDQIIVVRFVGGG
ncbi:thiamine biosynthesis protein ThiS [Geomicrobium halophilum]|uniref:Thiamine biosynthesis protein ThiS n=1 Tax=Geomicrobium halophilum TaxID=549000 RepID=A0A841PR38_9BACL|nr:sulfur carrier protein ThiS [Geomicrobium halophilum]MBB6450274.1 thiamine biosynthesis protein ThiS [Geomicrobium halophilum]